LTDALLADPVALCWPLDIFADVVAAHFKSAITHCSPFPSDVNAFLSDNVELSQAHDEVGDSSSRPKASKAVRPKAD
jgi:hypothetical protein